MTSTHIITYRIKLNEELTEIFDFELEDDNFNLVSSKSSSFPDWTRLENHQCSHCPLKVETHSYCPVATQLHLIIDRFHNTTSVDEVEVEVVMQERKVVKTTDLQSAISSMFGLVFPACGCPKTAYMKPMARFHLPLVTEEESIFHVTGMYLLSQYFREKGRISKPFVGLSEVYGDLHILNKSIKERITHITRSDSVKNAITLIDMYSTLIPMLIEDELVELRGFFNAYFSESEKLEQKKTKAETPGYLAKAKELKLELMPIGDDEKQKDSSGKKRNPFLMEDDEPVQEIKIEEKKPDPKDDLEKRFNIAGLSLQPVEEEVQKKPEKPITGKASFIIDDN